MSGMIYEHGIRVMSGMVSEHRIDHMSGMISKQALQGYNIWQKSGMIFRCDSISTRGV